MKHIIEVSKSIPVAAETEVLVVGGGPGGLSAALAVQRGVASREIPSRDVVAATVEHGAAPV